MHLNFYHPLKTGQGSAAQFFVSDRDNGLYLKISKQVSWDENKRTGSFYANTKDPNKHVMLKFSQTELGNLLLLLEKGVEFRSLHKSKERTVSFTFGLYKKDDVVLGTSWSIYKTANNDSTNKQQYGIALKVHETALLKQFIIEAVKRSFENQKDEDRSIKTDVTETPEVEETQRQASPTDIDF